MLRMRSYLTRPQLNLGVIRLTRFVLRSQTSLSGILILTCLACGDARVTRRPGEPDVVSASVEDADMGAAIAAARRSSADFYTRIARPTATQSYAAVKARLVDGDAVEHVWLSGLTLAGADVRGVLDNAPVKIRGRREGDTLIVSRDSITDWMLVDRDTVYGAFTVFVLRDQKTPAERADFDKQQRIYFGPSPRRLHPVQVP